MFSSPASAKHAIKETMINCIDPAQIPQYVAFDLCLLFAL